VAGQGMNQPPEQTAATNGRTKAARSLSISLRVMLSVRGSDVGGAL